MELALRINEANKAAPGSLGEFTMTVDDREVQSFIRNAIMVIGSPGSSALMRMVSIRMKKQSLERFRREGTPSEPWAQLAESTLAREGRTKLKRDTEREAVILAGINAMRGMTARNSRSPLGSVLKARKRLRPDERPPMIEEWKILQDNGLLRMSIENQADDLSATVGTALFYGVYHESDEPRTSNLPRRAFLGGDDPQEQSEIMDDVRDFLARIR